MTQTRVSMCGTQRRAGISNKSTLGAGRFVRKHNYLRRIMGEFPGEAVNAIRTTGISQESEKTRSEYSAHGGRQRRESLV